MLIIEGSACCFHLLQYRLVSKKAAMPGNSLTELPGVFLSSFLFSVSQICSCLIFSDMPLARASTHAPHVYEEKFAFQSLTYKGFEIGVFSDWNSRALGRPAAQSSGVEKTLSSVFFTLPKHAGALQCAGIVNEKFVKTISR